MWRQPVLRVLVVEWPRWHDDKEGEGGAGEANVQGEADVLLYVADDKGQNLQIVNLTSWAQWHGRLKRTPAAPSSTVLSISARRWPSKSCACVSLPGAGRQYGNRTAYNLALYSVAHLLQKLVCHGWSHARTMENRTVFIAVWTRPHKDRPGVASVGLLSNEWLCRDRIGRGGLLSRDCFRHMRHCGCGQGLGPRSPQCRTSAVKGSKFFARAQHIKTDQR